MGRPALFRGAVPGDLDTEGPGGPPIKGTLLERFSINIRTTLTIYPRRKGVQLLARSCMLKQTEGHTD